jgi:F0F1-type ATP synthase gamma subunit
MSKRGDFQGELEFYDVFKLVLTAYQQVALMKMKDNRDFVFNAREFLKELGYVYYQVKKGNQDKVDELNKKRIRRKGDPNAGKVKKKAAMLISANEKLQGDMPTKVFREFLHYVKEHDADIFVAGRVGEGMLNSSHLDKEHQYFDLMYNENFEEDLVNLTYLLLDYQSVVVFFGKFQSFINQSVERMEITGDVDVGAFNLDSEIIKKIQSEKFLFEPDIAEIVAFFDEQVRGALMRQSIYESRLAHFASRAKSMDEAISNIASERRQVVERQRRAMRLMKDRAQREQMNSVLFAFG